ncbi:hypothetical protein [Parapedobacter indicus]|uniref:Uncharacterized protein n=1 Tax=Parapedobacter indicus TaxID=1477437 RepID=A0A1I3MF04_9SPHI|nr:hypothetical protein [Parapedobacter indicus]PPL01194.1 hypothetical protein CLV26_1062 [Parapedobacter indicus]SFI95276.1 hypothetical protein SAMN05444682_106333 [Parapedobacter indicus]
MNLNNDQSFLKPVLSKGMLMRDPCIIRGSDGRFLPYGLVGKTEYAPGYPAWHSL